MEQKTVEMGHSVPPPKQGLFCPQHLSGKLIVWTKMSCLGEQLCGLALKRSLKRIKGRIKRVKETQRLTEEDSSST